MEPVLQRFERLARPRYWPLPQVMAERFVGLVVLVTALALVFPIPFGNWTPAVAAILVSLGLSERDGLWLGSEPWWPPARWPSPPASSARSVTPPTGSSRARGQMVPPG